jgi:predicted O-linked N-acetylglucosamine transferase (SPINDLY family)
MKLTIKQVLQQGVAAQQAGKLQEAERLYRAILKSQPNHSHANHNLGVLAVSVNKVDLALPFFKTALEADSTIEQFWVSYINTLVKDNQLESAKKAIKKAKKKGIAVKKLEALVSRSQVIPDAREPSQAQLDSLMKHYQGGRFGEAEKLAVSITNEFPKHPFSWKVLGAVLGQEGRYSEAVRANRTAIALSPQNADVYSNLGVALHELGRAKEAEAIFSKAIGLEPNYAAAHYNLANTYKDGGRQEDARVSYERAIALNPNYAEAHCNLGIVLKNLCRLDESEASSNRALELKPDFTQAHNNLGTTLIKLRRLDESEASYLRAITLEPNYLIAHSNLLFQLGSMNFDATRYQVHARKFSEILNELGSRFTSWLYSRDSECLRIGFVSGDFGSHPVGYFIEGLLLQLQSSSIELHAYSTAERQGDQITEELKKLFHSWTPLRRLSDEEAAQKIHKDGVHILIDLSGHTAKNRLGIFAWKPAPIQVSWLGYFASTGLPEMDYILGDPYVTPDEESDHFIEKIWQLPESYLCFTPPKVDLKVSDLPALSNGFVTFGCFNKLERMTDDVVSVRAKILHAVPGSKLFLKDKQLDHQTGRDRVLARFLGHGITAERLILEGKSPREEYLACYHRVDISLSPFPYGGGTTSAEGLWMGVPVIAKSGSYFLSHLGESIAHNSGLIDWIADDEVTYVAKAVQFSSDLKALATLRSGLREQVLQAPLFNTQRFVRHFEEAVWSMRRLLDGEQ